MSSPERLFQEAHQAYARGDIAAARVGLTGLRQMFPPHPSVLQLAALTEKKAGDLAAALALFRAAIPLAPGDSELQANYANTLAALEDRGAIAAYDAAIRLAPDRHDFRLNRAITHLQFGDVAAAEADIAFLEPHQQHSARFWSVAGEVYRAAGDRERAEAAFEAALVCDPDRVNALAALGHLHLQAGEPAARVYFSRALERAPHDRGLALGLSQALEMDGEIDAAIDVLYRAQRAAPNWQEGTSALARLLVEAGASDRAIALYREQADADPRRAQGWIELVVFLRTLDAHSEALAVLREARSVAGADAGLPLLEAAVAIDLGEAALADASLRQLPEDWPAARAVRVRHGLRFGAYDAAAALAETHLADHTEDIAMWALQSLCWRLTGDAREAWLNPPGTLVKALDIGFPGDPEKIAETLRKLHVARHRPAGQSLRNGTQTRGSLFDRRDPTLAALGQHIGEAIKRYRQGLPASDPRHPLLRHRERALRFSGSWSVRLTDAGFHVAHIHPAGIVSSAFYIVVPESLEGSEKAGWLETGSAPAELNLPLNPYAVFEPKPGRLVLFPSYLFHGTRPFDGGERLTVAFDLSPTP